MPTKKLDLSSEINDIFPDEDEASFDYVTANFGKLGDLRILQDLNTFLLIQLDDDPGAIAKTMVSVLHPDDRRQFLDFLNKRRSMNAEQLMKLFNAMLEVATGGRPTNSPSASSAGTGKKVVARRSAAS